jgi:hypothetical protein
MTTDPDDLELNRLVSTPQEYGFPEHPTDSNLRVWQRQEAFLSAFARCGKIGRAAQAVGISRACVERWQSLDIYGIYGFKKMIKEAHLDYVELLEEDMDDFIAVSKHNTQIARIFRLRAEAPEKYREEVKVLNVSAPIQMLDRLRELATKERKQQEALEAPAIEGEFKEVGATGREAPLPAGMPPPVARRLASPMTDYPVSQRRETSELPRKPKKEPRRVNKR